jgi:hypothetical protein
MTHEIDETGRGAASTGGSGAALQAAIGSTIVLASASTAGPGATITGYQWTLLSEPMSG